MSPASRLVSSFLFALASASLVAVEPGPTIPVSAPVTGRAHDSQSVPHVAFNGLAGYTVWLTGNDLYGSPVDESGAPRRATPTWLGSAETVDVAPSGSSGFLVASAFGGRTFLMDVSVDGAPRPAREISVTTCGSVKLEALGDSHLLTSGDAGSDCPSDIIAVDAQGQTSLTNLAPGAFQVRMSATAAFGGFVVSRGAMMIFPEHHFILDVRLVRADGSTVIQTDVPTDGTPIHSIASAASDSEALVVWGSEYGLRAQRLNRSLQPVGTTIVLRYDHAFVDGVVAIGDDFWVLTRGFEGDLSLARVHEGAVAGERAPLSTSAGKGDLAIAESRLLAVWPERSVTPSSLDWGDVQSTRVDPATAEVGTRHLVSTSAHAQVDPVVTFDGAAYAVAWRETTGDSSLILARRFTDSGEAVDAAPVQASELLHHAFAPAIAYNGSMYLLVWQEGDHIARTILGRHFLPSLEPVEPQPFVIATNGYATANPRLGSDGRDFLVVWAANAESPTHTYRSDVVARRVSGHSSQMDAATVVSLPSDSSQIAPDVVWDGRRYVAVWGTYHWFGGHSSTRTSILAATLDERGSVTDRITVVPQVWKAYYGPDSENESVYTPKIASGTQGLFVVWRSGNAIVGRYLEEPGAHPTPVRHRGVRRPPWIRMAERDAGTPSVAWDGSAYVVVWTENAYEAPISTESVRAVRIQDVPATEPFMESFEIARAERPTRTPAAVAAGYGTAMFAFARYEAEEPYSGAPRVYLRGTR